MNCVTTVEVELKKLAPGRGSTAFLQFLNEGGFDGDEVGPSLTRGDSGLDPIKSFSDLILVPVLQLTKCGGTFRVEAIEPSGDLPADLV
jgi:hypothetical protein